MSDVADLGPSASASDSAAGSHDAVEPASISDYASRAIEIASERQADREAGRDVPAELPDVSAALPRERDGRFTAKPAAAPAETDVQAATPDASAVVPAAAPTAEVPARWSEAKKADFARLAPDAQKLVLQHTGEQDADYTRKTQELSAKAKAAEPFLSTYSQHADFLNAQSSKVGVPPEQIMGNMIHVLRQGTTGQPHERAQAAAYVMSLFGLDSRSLIAASQGPASQGQAASPVEREIISLRQQQADHARFIEAAQQDQQRQHLASAQQSIDGFATAKDDAGQLKHPHFAAVRTLMAPHVEAGRTFDEAYAIAAKPIIDAISAHEQAARASQAAAAPASRASPFPVTRGSRPSAPRPAAARQAASDPGDISANAWEAMRKVGLA